ncbi:MAG TPA: PAS domain S-box protein, partial [Aquabacterium sp.]|nr:PAS domain S-box protein [Aquabacterium sp.]
MSWWQRNGTRSVLLVGGLLSAVAYFVQIRVNERIVLEQTQAEANTVANQSVRAVVRAASGLRGARGFVLGAGLDQVSSDRFLAYFRSRDLAREFPGVTGVGLIRRVAAGQLQAYVADVGRRDRSDFQIRQLGSNEGERRIIELVEPIATNGLAIGLDVASEAQRRAASERALVVDQPTLTGPVQLVQSGPGASKGLLMMLRLVVDEGGARYGIKTGARGYVYSPIQLDELLSQTGARSHKVAMTLDDVTDPDHSISFALPTGEGLEGPWGPQLVEREVLGRKWRFTVFPTPAMVESLRLRSPAAGAAVGGVATLLLAGWVSVSNRLGRRTRQALDERAQLLSMLEQAGDAVIALDRQQRVTMWNRAAADLFGFQPEECMGRPIGELTVPADHRDEEDQLMQDALSGRGTSPFETRRKNRAGELIDVEVWAVPLSNGRGQIVGVVKQIRPIRERVQQRLQLQEYGEALEGQVQERTRQLQSAWKDLQDVIDAIPSMVASWDRQLRNRFVNRAAEAYLGWKPQDLLGRHLSEFLGEELFKENLPLIQQVLAGQAVQFERSVPIPGRHERRNVLVHYTPQREGDAVVGFYALVQDISEVVRSRTALQALQREQQATLDALNQIVLVSVTDRSGKIEHVNDEFCRLSQFDRSELIGQTHHVVNAGVHPPEFWMQMWQTILRGEFWRGEICNRAKDGSLFWVSTAIVPIQDAQRQVERFMSIRFDITERKAMEQALTQSEAMLARTGEIGRIGGWEWD